MDRRKDVWSTAEVAYKIEGQSMPSRAGSGPSRLARRHRIRGDGGAAEQGSFLSCPSPLGQSRIVWANGGWQHDEVSFGPGPMYSVAQNPYSCNLYAAPTTLGRMLMFLVGTFCTSPYACALYVLPPPLAPTRSIRHPPAGQAR